MSLQYILDTNVLVYLHESSNVTKRTRAEVVLRKVGAASSAALPAQVLAEFASVTMKKLKPPLAPSAVEVRIDMYERAFPVLPLTAAVVREAVRGVREYQLAYYDAQLWAIAKLSQIPVILSEDFNQGSRLEGISFVNPFAPDFDVRRL